jgi:parallel beta helix pectate lyase-like protein
MPNLAKVLGRMVPLCLLTSAFGTSASKAQQTIHVPADQPTIQAGIDAAGNGDTVLVAPGTYVENISFKGKAITVTSSSGPAQTIIDGSQGDIVVRFVSGETRASTINGFTIKDAGASQYPNNNPNLYFHGILVSYTTTNSVSNPTITNNIITQNHGYGIEVHFGGAFISGNTISYTTTQYDPRMDFGCDYDDGDGIYIDGTPNDSSVTTVIQGNIIERNVGHCLGGGIGLYAAGAPTVTNNIIRYNESLGEGGGIYMVNGNALSIVQNLIYGNISAGGGGGIYLGNSSQNLLIVNNTIVGNTISPNPDIIDFYEDGSQIFFAGSVSGTLFFNNIIVAGDSYSAVACNPSYQYLSTTPLTINNSDILNFSGPTFGGWCVVPPTVTSGTISADSQFVTTPNGPFRLGAGSPAINAGTPSAPQLPPQDLAGNSRIQGNAIDMGAYEGSFVGIGSALPDFSLSSAPSSLSITAGQSGMAVVSVTPTGGFIGTLSFACSGLPIGAHCSFSQPKLATGGDNAVVSTNLTVTTSAAVAGVVLTVCAKSNPTHCSTSASLNALLVVFVLIGGGTLLRSTAKPQRFLSFVVVLLSLMCAAVTTSCGGGSNNQPALPAPPSPPGLTTSTVVITASVTGNTTTKSQSLNLVVIINNP